MAIKDSTSGMMRILTFEETLNQIRNDKRLSERPSPQLTQRLNTFWFQSPFNQRMYNEVGEDLKRTALVQAETAKAQQSFSEFAAASGIPANVMRVAMDADDTPLQSESERGTSPGPRQTISKKRQSKTGLSHIPQTQHGADVRDQLELQGIAEEAAQAAASSSSAAAVRDDLSRNQALMSNVTSISVPKAMAQKIKQSIKERKEKEKAAREKRKAVSLGKASSTMIENATMMSAQSPVMQSLGESALSGMLTMAASRDNNPDRINEMDNKRTQEDAYRGLTRLRKMQIPVQPDRRRPKTS